jgi:hypothetical protein
MKKTRTSRLLQATKSKRGQVDIPMDGISKNLNEALLQFIESHPASRFSRNLRTLLIEFLMFEGATEVSYLPDLLYDLQGLFSLLDVIQAENSAGKA